MNKVLKYLLYSMPAVLVGLFFGIQALAGPITPQYGGGTSTSTVFTTNQLIYQGASSYAGATVGTGLSLSGGVLSATGGVGLTAPFQANGTVAGINATSSTVSFNIQGTGALNPFNVASSTGTSLFQVAANGSTTISTLGTGVVNSTAGLLGTIPSTNSTDCILANGTSSNAACGSNLYNVITQFNASGMAATTTANSTINSASITVGSTSTFKVGQGIFITGAGVGGNNLVAKINAISGTTITLDRTASTTKSSVMAQHDDTFAINAALAAAFNGNGGTVIAPSGNGIDGVYKMSAPADPVTGGVLTLPQNLVYQNPTTVKLLGTSEGQIAPGNFYPRAGGTTFDFSNATNTPGSAFAAAPFFLPNNADYVTRFEPVNFVTDDIFWILPTQSKLNGLLLTNAFQAKIGPGTSIVSKVDPGGSYLTPTGNSVGVWMPAADNNVLNQLDQATIGGFNIGVIPGDHTILNGPYLVLNNNCMAFYGHNYDEVTGMARCEQSSTWIYVDSSVDQAIVDINLDVECGAGPSGASCGQNVQDSTNKLQGIIRYKNYPNFPNISGTNANVKTVNLGNSTEYFPTASSTNFSISNKLYLTSLSAGNLCAGAGGVIYTSGCSGGGTSAPFIVNGTVAGVNATSSTVSFNIQATAGLSPFNIASTSGATIFSINSSGQAFLQPTATGTAFQILNPSGQQTFVIDQAATLPGLNVNAPTSTQISSLYVIGTTASSTAPVLVLASSTGTSLFQVGADGKVGVGTTTPTTSLSLDGTNATLKLKYCFEINDSVSSSTVEYVYTVSGTLTASPTKPAFCQ